MHVLLYNCPKGFCVGPVSISMSVRPFSVRPYVRIFWEFYASWQAPATTFLDPYVQAKSQEAKNRSEKTDFKAGKERSSRKCFWKRSEKLSSGYDARKYRIVFCWIHMIGVKPPKNQHFQPVNTSNTSDWRVRTNLNGTAQKPWGPPLPRGCNLVHTENTMTCLRYRRVKQNQ